MLFNENGDAPGRYEIYQYQIRNRTAEYKIIGHWTDQLHMNVSAALPVYSMPAHVVRIFCQSASKCFVSVSVCSGKSCVLRLCSCAFAHSLIPNHLIVLSAILKGVNIQRALK